MVLQGSLRIAGTIPYRPSHSEHGGYVAAQTLKRIPEIKKLELITISVASVVRQLQPFMGRAYTDQTLPPPEWQKRSSLSGYWSHLSQTRSTKVPFVADICF